MKTYAVTSGKGGVGKTNLSANLAIVLSSLGKRTIVFDADIGLANLDVVLGCKAGNTLQNAISGDCPLADAVHQGPGGIRFIPGGSGVESLLTMSGSQSERFLTELRALEKDTDVLIFDTGAGIDNNVMTFLNAADEVLLVVTPDPSSLTDGYATAKALLMQNPTAVIRVILNMADSEEHGKSVFGKLAAVAQQFLNAKLEYAGSVRMDGHAIPYIRKRVPFTIGDPNLRASQDVKAIAQRLNGQSVTVTAQKEDLATRLKSLFSFGKKAA